MSIKITTAVYVYTQIFNLGYFIDGASIWCVVREPEPFRVVNPVP